MPSKDIKLADLPAPDELAQSSGQELTVDTLPEPGELSAPRATASQSAQTAQPPTKLDSLARGAGQGVTFGTQPILAGAGAAAMQGVTGNQGPKQGRNLEALMAAYKEMRNQEMAKNQAASQANPKSYMAGQFAGAIPTTVATAGSANPSMATMTKQGAAAGLGSYLGSTQDPNAKGAAISTGVGAALPTAIGASGIPEVAQMVGSGLKAGAEGVGSAISGIASKVAPQAMKEGFYAGTEGTNLMSNKAKQEVLPEEAPKAADNLTQRMLKVNTGLRTDIDKVLTDATQGGQSINMEQPFQSSVNQLDHLVSSDSSYGDPDTESGKFASKLFRIIKQYKAPGEEETDADLVDQFGRPLRDPDQLEAEGHELKMDLTPIEMRNLANEVGEYASILSANKESKLAKIAYNFSNGIKQQLRQAVPDYADAADRLSQFQTYMPETIMSRGEDPHLSDVKLSNSASQYQDIKDSTQDMIQNLAKNGSGSDQARQTFNRLDESLNTLNTLENARAAEAKIKGEPFVSVWDQMGLNKDDTMQYLQSKAQRVAAYDSMKTGTLPVTTPKSVAQTLGSLATKTGVAIGNVGGLAYNAPKDVYYAAAQKLSSNPAVAHLGVALKAAVASGDVTKQNAAIFAIMQNPTAKSVIDPNFKEEANDQRTPKKQPYGTYGF